MTNLRTAVFALLLLAPIALAAGRDLAPRPLGPSSYQQDAPLVAYAGGKYLAVWLESLHDEDGRYLGAFVDASGKRISPSAFLLSEGLGGPPQLIGAGNSFALFFAREPYCPQMVLIDLEGRVTARRLLPIEYIAYERPVAWNGTHFAFVDHRRVVFFDRMGNVVRKVEILCSPVRNDLAAAGRDVIVASVCRGGRLRTHVVTPEGNVTTTMIDPSFPEKGVRIAAAPAGNDATLLVWGTDDALQSAVLSPDGVPAPQKLADKGSVPLVLTKTPNGFLLAFTTHGRFTMATLHEDGSLRVVHDAHADAVRRTASAATEGTNVLVASIAKHGRARAWLFTPNAHLAASDLLSIVPARQLAPAIGAGSESLVAAWTERQDVSTAIVRTARLAPDGTILGAAVIHRNATLASDDLAWNGAHYLTVILANGQLRTQRITAFGEPLGDSQHLYDLPAYARPHAAVVWAGDRWVVVGNDESVAFYSEIAPGGEHLTWSLLPLEGPLHEDDAYRGRLNGVALAYDGKRVHVAWTEAHVPCWQVCIGSFVAFVSTIEDRGTRISTPRRLSKRLANDESVSLAANGDEVVVIANGYETSVTTLGGASRTFDGDGDVTWDGSTFVLALRAREQLTVRRLDGRLRDAGHPRVAAIAPANTAHSLPSVAAVIPGNAIIGIQEIETTSGARAVAYVEEELVYEYEPRRRRTVRR
jgi:hypothetical protein